jgi:GrpB-like predicted nucleotidyltransferase (UPF0157 family)
MHQAPLRDRDGLPLSELKLVQYNTNWPKRFEDEFRRLKSVPHVISIEHIGSTAIPNIMAKPVIDIAMMVDNLPEDQRVSQSLVNIGYKHHGDYGLPGRQFFTWGDPPVIHLHVVGQQSHYWHDWITFRDFLRETPDWRQRYEAEKVKLMQQANGNRKHYTESKTSIIQEILKAAEGEQHDCKS